MLGAFISQLERLLPLARRGGGGTGAPRRGVEAGAEAEVEVEVEMEVEDWRVGGGRGGRVAVSVSVSVSTAAVGSGGENVFPTFVLGGRSVDVDKEGGGRCISIDDRWDVERRVGGVGGGFITVEWEEESDGTQTELVRETFWL